MAITYSESLRISLIGAGDQPGVWGSTTNTNLGTLLETAIAGNAVISIGGSGVHSLSANNGALDEARQSILTLFNSSGGDFVVLAPPQPKQYIVFNTDTTYSASIGNSTANNGLTPTGGTTVIVAPGKKVTVYTDGANFFAVDASGFNGVLPVSNGGTGTNYATGVGATVLNTSPTLVTPILGTPTSGTATNLTGLPLTTGVTGTLPVANGGTGSTTSTGTGAVVRAVSPALTTPDLGTPSALVGTNITGVANNFTSTRVTTNANLTGDVTSVGNATTLSNSGVTAGVYVSTNITVDAKGRITAASSGSGGGGVSTFSAGATGLTPVAATAGTVTLSGVLLPAYGGTGVTTSTGTGSTVLNTSPSLVTPVLGTPTSGNFSTGAFTWPTFNQSTTGSAATAGSAAILTTARNIALAGNVTGTVAFDGSANVSMTTTLANGAVTATKLGANVAGNGPAIWVGVNATQNIVANVSAVLVNFNLFGTQGFDTNSCFNPTGSIVGGKQPYSFTPNAAGYYQVNALIQFQDTSISDGFMACRVFKSGVFLQEFVTATIQFLTVGGGLVVYMNGTTDYLQVYMSQSNSASTTKIMAGQQFNACFVRNA